MALVFVICYMFVCVVQLSQPSSRELLWDVHEPEMCKNEKYISRVRNGIFRRDESSLSSLVFIQ